MRYRDMVSWPAAAVAGLVILLAASPWALAVTDDQAIDEVMTLRTVQGADDLVAEMAELAGQFAADPNDYGGIGVVFTGVLTQEVHFRGTTVSTMAMCVPLLSGDAKDPATPRGKLALRLKKEVTDYLLKPEYWEWEQATRKGEPYVSSPSPEVTVVWDHKKHGGPWWEKMYGLWAYAYYSGDWDTIKNNWEFVRNAYTAGYRQADQFQRACMGGSLSPKRNTARYRIATNDLANGLIGYFRMATHMADPTAKDARDEAKAALREVAARVDVSWDRCPIIVNWTDTIAAIRGEWTPGYNLTPELGRWIHEQAIDVARKRLDEAANAAPLKGHWWCGYFNNYSKGASPEAREWMSEQAWGLPALSHELFIGRAWMLQESGQELRKVKPWHVIMGSTPEYRDMLYIRSLYALISRHADVQWTPAGK